ncbi:hypothetical protein GG344DRAFT_69126 [Lentinula edodes]|nr:hypothetical protein GG344DRAFT_69126 [Lentinula edodes]
MQICDYCGCFLKQHNQKSSEAKPPPPSTSTSSEKSTSEANSASMPGSTTFRQAAFDRLAASERLRDRHQDTMNGLGRSATIDPAVAANLEQFKNSHSRPIPKKSKWKSATGDQEEDPLAKSKKLKPTNPLEIWVILVEDTAAVDAGNCKALSPASITRIWNKASPGSIEGFRYIVRETHGPGNPVYLKLCLRGDLLTFTDLKDGVIEQGTNQATRKFGPRVWIALAAGSGPAFKSDTTPSPNETSQFNVLNEDSEPTWDDWDDETEDQSDYKPSTAPVFSSHNRRTRSSGLRSPPPAENNNPVRDPSPLPPTGTDSDPGLQIFHHPNNNIGMHDIFEMTGCKINELWKLCFYITGPSYMAVSWWPSTLEGRFKILNPIINRIEADIRRLRKPNSKHSLLAILDDCHDEGDLLPTLQPLGNLWSSNRGIIADDLYELIEAEKKITKDLRGLYQGYNSIKTASSDILFLVKHFMSAVDHALRSPPGFSELFRILECSEKMATLRNMLPIATESQEYSVLSFPPNEEALSRPVLFWSHRLSQDFGSSEFASGIKLDSLRLGSYGIEGLQSYLVAFLAHPPNPMTVHHHALFKIFSTFAKALAERLSTIDSETKKKKRQDREYVEISDEDEVVPPSFSAASDNKDIPRPKPKPSEQPADVDPNLHWMERLKRIQARYFKGALVTETKIRNGFQALYLLFPDYPTRRKNWDDIAKLDLLRLWKEMSLVFHPDRTPAPSSWIEKGEEIMKIVNAVKVYIK